jgi:hypothetical protein
VDDELIYIQTNKQKPIIIHRVGWVSGGDLRAEIEHRVPQIKPTTNNTGMSETRRSARIQQLPHFSYVGMGSEFSLKQAEAQLVSPISPTQSHTERTSRVVAALL